MQDTRTDNTLLDIITCMRKHFIGMLIVFAGVISVAIAIILIQTPTYEVNSRVLVKYGREYIYNSVSLEEEGTIPPLYTYNSDKIISSEIEIFKSTDLAEEVITSLGVEKLFPNLALKAKDKSSIIPIAVNGFTGMLDVFHVKGSDVIGITFQHKDPKMAVEAVSHLLERFKERHLQIFKNPQTPLLKEQVELHRQQLEESENALTKFKQENNIYTEEILAQQKTYIDHYSKLKNLLLTDIVKMEGLAEMKSSLESQLEEIPETRGLYEDAIRGSDTETVGYKLLDLQMQEKDLLNKYTEENREVESIRQKIALAETFIENQEVLWQDNKRTGENQLYSKVRKELISLTANYVGQEKRNDKLRRLVNQSEKELQEMIPLGTELNRLNRQVESAEKTYSMFLEKYEESRLQDAMDSKMLVNVVVIENPRVPLKPSKPRKRLSLLVGIILGAACSLFYALFVEYALARKI